MQPLRIASHPIDHPEADYLVLAGPTAVGKTDLVEQLAAGIPLEVVSADSRQVYRGMDIGTATPASDLLDRIHHHFINELEPDVVWNAGTFYRAARERIRQIISAGNLPVAVGGAGLYLEALRGGFFSEEEKDLDVRRRYESRLASIGAEALWKELAALDPEYAATFHHHDHKKLVRAFEIYEFSGLPPTEAFAAQKQEFDLHECYVVLSRDREQLYRRIDERVFRMLEAGLVQECRDLLERGYGPELYPLRTIGYKEVFAFLDGACTEAEMIADIQKHTRNFAKRQHTWFRNHPFDEWIDL